MKPESQPTPVESKAPEAESAPETVKVEEGTLNMSGTMFHKNVDKEWPVLQSLYYVTCREPASVDAMKHCKPILDYVDDIASDNECEVKDLDLAPITYEGRHREAHFTGNLDQAYNSALVSLAISDLLKSLDRSAMKVEGGEKPQKEGEKPAVTSAPKIAIAKKVATPVTPA